MSIDELSIGKGPAFGRADMDLVRCRVASPNQLASQRKTTNSSTAGGITRTKTASTLCQMTTKRLLDWVRTNHHEWLGYPSLTSTVELQHQIWDTCLTGRLSLCPLNESPRNVLDIGCGTGAWAIDFAKAHPNSRVTGMDLSSIQPSTVPSNVAFVVGDFTAPWDIDHRFDYVHSRAITIGVRDWGKLVDEVWRNLEPGGWVEFQEYHLPWTSDDGSVVECPKFEQWNQEIFRAAKKAGMTPDAILQVPDLLEKRGFVGAKTAWTKWAIGPWAKGAREKRVGELYLEVSAGAQY